MREDAVKTDKDAALRDFAAPGHFWCNFPNRRIPNPTICLRENDRKYLTEFERAHGVIVVINSITIIIFPFAVIVSS